MIAPILLQNKHHQATEILQKLLSEYKDKIPHCYTDKIIFSATEIPHSHPKITLNYRWMSAPDPESTLLMLYCHEQLHWFEAGILNDKLLDFLKTKCFNLFDNPRYLNEFRSDERNLLIHVIVLTNELKLANELLTNQQYSAVYYSNYWQPYTKTRTVIERRLTYFINFLTELNAIWSSI